MPSAAEHIGSLIEAAGGALRFDHFMNEALYGAYGFYTAGIGRAGRRGDFITSPEVGPLFGTVLARALDAWWREMGSPTDFRVFDVGAGPGTLARSVVAAHPDCLVNDPANYVCVEVSQVQRQMHPDGVTSLARMPEGEIQGVILANELLDNVPFRLLVCDGVWREAWVTSHHGLFNEELRKVDESLKFSLPVNPPHGARLPFQQVASQWMQDILGRLHGRLIVIDYAVPLTADLAFRPWRDWLRTYAGHEKGAHYLRNVGAQDITNEVCIDQLISWCAVPTSVRSQSQFLQLWGINELVDEGRRMWAQQAALPDLVAMKMRSRISEAEALLDINGLGSFTILEWSSIVQ